MRAHRLLVRSILALCLVTPFVAPLIRWAAAQDAPPSAPPAPSPPPETPESKAKPASPAPGDLETPAAAAVPEESADAAAEVDAALAAITAERLMGHVRALADDAMQGRAAGSEGARLAAAHLIRQFESIGLEPAGTDGFRQPFTVPARRGREELRLENVVARLPGADPELADEIVVVGAHYDHLGVRRGEIMNGADDNASGCAALLEIARALASDPPARTVVLVAFDGEEIGLRGSRHFVRHPPLALGGVVAMLNADMISRGPDDRIHVNGAATRKDFRELVEASARRVGLRATLDAHPDWRHASDHAPFADEGIPHLYFGVEDHADYHRPTDDVEKVNAKLLERVARLMFLTARELANARE